MSGKLRLVLLASVCFAWVGSLQAQDISPQLSAGSGWMIKVDNQQFDMSSGEIAVTTISNGTYQITQGFHQPIDLFTPCAEFQLTYYPNPVKEQRFYITTTANADVLVYNVLGKLVMQHKVTPSDNDVMIGDLKSGVYLIKINSGNRSTTKKLIVQ